MTQTENSKLKLRGMTATEMETMSRDAGFDAYRGRQVYHWVQRRMARTIDEMKNIPVAFREWLSANVEMGGVKEAALVRQSADGSYKFLFHLGDDRKVESVLMVDRVRNYWTQCVSSQVGCAVDCKFCVTGFNGFFRNLRTDEIVDQVIFARRHLLENEPGSNYRNLVYMGMGEPLLNTDAVIASIRILTDKEGIDLSPRRITVSTSGIVPGMIQLAESGVEACLALSLNGSNQTERTKIMPIGKKYPLDEVLDVCRRYKFGKNKRVTFEYVLLHGVNDSERNAREVVRLMRGLPCKINLIPFNPSPLLPYERPQLEHVDAFAAVLKEAHLSVSVRWSKALDVDGACGQLAGDQRKKREVAAASAAPEGEGHDLDFFAPVGAGEADDEAD